MCISDWSSDVCSSVLDRLDAVLEVDGGGEHDAAHGGDDGDDRQRDLGAGGDVDVGLVAHQHRLEPAAEEVEVAGEGQVEPTADDGQASQHDERNRHLPGRLMGFDVAVRVGGIIGEIGRAHV